MEKKMETEIGVRRPQARELMESPEGGRGKDESSLEDLEGARHCQHIDFGLLTSRAMRECISEVLGCPVCGTL